MKNLTRPMGMAAIFHYAIQIKISYTLHPQPITDLGMHIKLAILDFGNILITLALSIRIL